MVDCIDLNCDLGEGMGDDEAMLDIVSSVNVACGFHAGDTETMRGLARHCLQRNIALGAHPSFPDRENFGRRNMQLAPQELRDILHEQIDTLQSIARAEGIRLTHVRTHGALANMSEDDRQMAATVATTVFNADPALILMSRPHSATDVAARALGQRVVRQGFADRAYQDSGALLPRSKPGAVITDANTVAERALKMVLEQRVESVNGTSIDLPVQTICVHGDTAGAIAMAATIRTRLENAGVAIKPFSNPSHGLSNL